MIEAEAGESGSARQSRALRSRQIASATTARAASEAGLGVGVRINRKPEERRTMGYVVPFMNGKGGTGKSVLARAYAVEAARAGASVLIADLDDVQRTSKNWADHRKRNGLTPEIPVEVATPRLAYDMVDRSDILVIDAPGWTDRESLKMAHWSTFCVIPSRANRMDDLSETVRLLHALKAEGIQDWRFGVALNALRAATAIRMTATPEPISPKSGFKALPGFVRDLKDYEIALLEGKAITETSEKKLNDEAFVLVDGIAGAVLEAGKRLTREAEGESQAKRPRQRRAWAMTKSNFDKLAKAPMFARPPRADDAQVRTVWAPSEQLTVARRGGPDARCNSRPSFRRNSGAG